MATSYCPNCGADLVDGSRGCGACGATMAAAAASSIFAEPAYAAPVPAVTAQAAPAALQAAGKSGRRMGFHLKRALNWNLRAIPVEEEERERLVALSVDEEDARRYLVWRRSVLIVVALPTLVSALLATRGALGTDYSGLSPTGRLLELARLAALYAMPLTAWLAARTWDRHRRSRTILLRGWLVAFLTPLALALFPFSWYVDLSGSDATVASQATALLSVLGAVSVYVTLMPAVLSLIPGVLRACLRVKALLPASILPGWFLVAATPLYVLLFLVIFTTVNQLAGNILLILAVLALLGAPLLYLFNASTFTRPLHDEAEIARVGTVQTQVGIVSGIGIALLLLYSLTAEIMGQSLIGLDEARSLLRPWDPNLFQIPLEYVVRSLFTTALVADLFMQMNLSVWQHTKAFAGTAEAESYDRVMSEIEEAGSRA
jgi:hypothetical protein